MAKSVFLKRSSVPGKLPDSKDDVSYGELLVNYAAGNEFIGFKNSDNEYARINAHPDAADVSFNVESHADSGFTGTTAEESIAQIETEILNNENVVSASLNDVNSRISEVDANIGNKVDKVDGKGLSTNDYTTDEKTKLSGVEANAQVNVISGIQRNGVDLTPDDNKKVNVIVPVVADDIVFGGEHSDSGFTGTTVLSSITQIENEIMSNEKTVSASLNDIKTKLSAIPEATVTGVTGDILSLSDKLVNATVALAYGDTETFESKKSIKLIGKDSKVLSEIDASDFIKDGMIDSVAFDEATHILTLTFNTEAGKDPITVDLKSLVDTYKAGDGLTLGTDGTFSVKDEIARVGTSADTKASNTVEGAKRYADNLKTTVDAYTVNGKKISETPELKAADIDVESHSDSGFTGTTVQESIVQIEAEMLNNEKTVSGALNDVNSRVSDAETAIGNKVDKVDGKGLSTNDYTDEEKAKVASALQSFTETDPTVPDWAKQSTKPTYTAAEVGALPSTTKIPSKTSDLTNDSGFLTEHQQLKTIDGETIVGDGNLSTAYDISTLYQRVKNVQYGGDECYTGITTDEYNQVLNNAKLGKNIFAIYDNKVVTFTTQTETDSNGKEYIYLINNTFGSLEYAQVTNEHIAIEQGYHNRFKVEKVIRGSTDETINLNPDYDYVFYYIDSDAFDGLSSLTININSAENEHRGVCEWAIQFDVPSDMTTLPTINWDSTLLWANGEVMSIEAGYTYEFDIIKTPYTASIVGQKFNTVSE